MCWFFTAVCGLFLVEESGDYSLEQHAVRGF